METFLEKNLGNRTMPVNGDKKKLITHPKIPNPSLPFEKKKKKKKKNRIQFVKHSGFNRFLRIDPENCGFHLDNQTSDITKFYRNCSVERKTDFLRCFGEEQLLCIFLPILVPLGRHLQTVLSWTKHLLC
jgi:hypothetical protein